MDDLIVGILAVLVGALFCLRGYLAMRLVIPVWGAFSGLVFGAGLASAITDDELLGTALGWGLGLLFAALFGVLAYLYYQFAVVLGLGAIGFSIGTGLMVALGVEWSWPIVLVGLVVGVALGALALAVDLPMVLLVAFSALAGGVIVVAGAMLVFGAVDLEQLNARGTTEVIDDDAFWYVIYVLTVVAGTVAQLRSMQQFEGGLRDAWDDGGYNAPPPTAPPSGLPA